MPCRRGLEPAGVMAIIYDPDGYMGSTCQAIISSDVEYGPAAESIPPGALVFRGPPTYDAADITFNVETAHICPYCGSRNNADREKCHGCQAPLGVT